MGPEEAKGKKGMHFINLPPWFDILAQLALSARDLDDFYFPLTEEKLEKAKEEEESEMEVKFEETRKMEMEEKDVENALAPGLEPTTSEM